MSKHFAMLNAARCLENYLSRENYNLNKMAENERIPHSLLEKKVDHYNELVDTLNELFATLTESPSSQLFTRYVIDPVEEIPDEEYEVVIGDSSAEDNEGENPTEFVSTRQMPLDEHIAPSLETVEEVEKETDEVDEEPGEPSEPVWKSEGYETYDAWLADKDAEHAQSPDDLALSVNDAMSQHRAGQALDEYSETSERDIASYLPEDDSPVSVLPSEDENNDAGTEQEQSQDKEVSAADYKYLDHTVDNVRVDSDPTQIAGVETAVERYGEDGRKGTDIDVSSFLYQSDGPLVDDLISDDIDQLQSSETTTTSTESDA